MLSQMSSSCIFVAERNGCYPFLSPALGDVFGFEISETGSSSDGDFLEHHIHPADLPVFVDVQNRLLDDLIGALPAEEQKDYKHIFEFRALDKTGNWVRVISQHQILDISSKGTQLILGAIDMAPDQTPGMGLRFTLMNYKTGEIVPFSVREEAGLSPREKEVLRLIDEGMYSKDISDKLSISIHTVNRHRQNILQKLSAGNTREAVNYARRLGLLF
jgi:DNA-binding CsgD family transcriptional regulator